MDQQTEPLGHDEARGLAPGSRRDSPARGPQSLMARLGIVPRMSDPIPIDAVEAGVPYLIVDANNRILCGPDSSWNWAWFGQYADWSSSVLGVCFTGDPTAAPSTLTLGGSRPDIYLRDNGSSTNWDWVFWGDTSWSNTKLSMTAVANGAQFQLKYMNGATAMYLSAALSSSWDYAFVGQSPAWTPLNLTLRKFYLGWDDLKTILQATWPAATLNFSTLRTLDAKYQLLPDSVATAIYTDSQLSTYKYKADVFDCDDFATVYKAQAAKRAYSQNRAISYAVGMVAASAGASYHAANLFVDLKGNVRVIEPQNGNITAGANWSNGGTSYVPYDIVF